MRNGLRAADEVIIPVDTGYFALHGLTRQLSTMEQIAERYGRHPAIRVLPNQYDVRTKLAREILAELNKRFKGLVLSSVINFNTKLKEGTSYGQPITEFAPNSMGARDFQALAREIVGAHANVTPSPDLYAHVERLARDAERLLATTTTLVESGNLGDARREWDAIPGGILREIPAGPPVGERGPVLRPVSAPPPTSPARTQPVVAPPTAPREQKNNPAPAALRRPPGVFEPTPNQPVGQARSALVLGDATTMPAASEPSMTSTRVSPPRTPASPVRPASTPEEIDRKIAAIYGARQDGEVVVFRSRHPDAAEVQIAGYFNDWMPHTTPMLRMPTGDYEARLRLPRGRYRYRLVVDGRWAHDPNNPNLERNEYGELNSVVVVER
jgi:chromosome partitioning protein